MDRTPYNVGPYGEDQYPEHLGPSEEFEKSGYIFVYQDVRGRWMSEGDFVEMRPHIDDKKSPQDVDDSSDTYDTIEFLLKHVRQQQRQGGHLGHLLSGLLYLGLDHRLASGAGGGQPAGAHDRPLSGRRRLSRRSLHALGQLRLLRAFFHPQTEPQTPKPTVPFDFGTPDSYKFYLQAGNIANLDKLYLKGSNWLFNDQAKHDTYDATGRRATFRAT